MRIGAPGVRDAHGEWARLREIAEDVPAGPPGRIHRVAAGGLPSTAAAAIGELSAALTVVLQR